MSFLSNAFSAVATTIKSMFSDPHAPPLIQSSSPRVPSPIPSAVPPLSPSIASNHSRSPRGDNPFWTEHQPKRKHNDREGSEYMCDSPDEGEEFQFRSQKVKTGTSTAQDTVPLAAMDEISSRLKRALVLKRNIQQDVVPSPDDSAAGANRA